ncbi:MAG: CHASE domain-containing protein [Ignavibacteria bacterium]|nr:CHASE domain-containing protein [Ignavibacteria bacterium]
MTRKEPEVITYEAILKDISKKKKSFFSFARAFPAYLVLLVMLGLSFLIYYNFEVQVRNERRAAFEKAVNSVLTRFQIHYNAHIQVANSIRGLYDNFVQVVRDYLLLYGTVPTKTYPSILGFASVQKIPRYRLSEFVYYVQGQGYHDYKLHPYVEKQIYYPIEFIIPEEPNKKFRGLDISSVPNLNSWFQMAIETGEPTATKVFNFRGSDTLSLFLIYPVYDRAFPLGNPKNRREAFKSAVLMEIDIPRFFKDALGAGVPSDTSIIFSCFQKENEILQTSLFKSSNYHLLASGFTPLLTQTSEFDFLDKKVYISFASIPDFGGTFQKYLPVIALGVSVLLSFVFFGFVISITTSRARAIDLAERMTRSQRRIVESSKDIIGVLDLDGVWKTINPASLTLFGYEPTELIGKKVDQLFMNVKDVGDFYSLLSSISGEFTRKVDYKMKSKNGEEKWVNWSFTISPSDGLIYAIGRDVTLEKRAEFEEKVKAKQVILAEQISREASEFKSYFMTKFSHNLRNVLTTISGYQQIIAEGKYDSDEELNMYARLAVQETQKLLSSVSDLFDVADFGKVGSKVLGTVNVYNVFNEAVLDFERTNPSKKIIVDFEQGSQNVTVSSERNELRVAFENLFLGLVNASNELNLTVQILESQTENIAEIQILSQANEIVKKMIYLYNENQTNLIEAIRYDIDDVLLNFSLFSSKIRSLNGQVKLDVLEKEGNLVTIILPKVR